MGKRQVAHKNRGFPAYDPGGTVAAKSDYKSARSRGGQYKNNENSIRTDGGDKRTDSRNFRTTSELAVMMEFIYLFEKKTFIQPHLDSAFQRTWMLAYNLLGC